MSCLDCTAGYHWYCAESLEDFADDAGTGDGKSVFCCCSTAAKPGAVGSTLIDVDKVTGVNAGVGGRSYKSPFEMKDVESSGRKRAADLFPIKEGMICEWANLLDCGGGVQTITGCMGNKAVAAHHGPDKSTLNNSEGNVHRICALCHNRWHTLNDPLYGPRPAAGMPFLPLGYDCLPHISTNVADANDQVKSELFWQGRKVKQVSGG